MSIGEKIKELRLKNNLKQKDIADALFVSEKTISSWENDRTSPDLGMIYKLSSILKVSFIYFINESNNKDINEEVSIKAKVDKCLFNDLFSKNKGHFSSITKLNQEDNYFEIGKNNWLRLRNENGKYSLNYKKRTNDLYFKKYNVEIDNLESMRIIINNLGYKSGKTIIKERTKVIYDNRFEINFDNVKDIGYFIEIKQFEEIKNYKETAMLILDILKKLDIDYKLITNKKYIDY